MPTGRWIGWRHLGLHRLTRGIRCVLGSKREKKRGQNHILPSSPDFWLVCRAGGVRPGNVKHTLAYLGQWEGLGGGEEELQDERGAMRTIDSSSDLNRWRRQARSLVSHGGGMAHTRVPRSALRRDGKEGGSAGCSGQRDEAGHMRDDGMPCAGRRPTAREGHDDKNTYKKLRK